MARSARIVTLFRRTIRRSLVRIAIRRQTRTGPECRILTFARHLPHAGTIRRLGATTVIRIDGGRGHASRASEVLAGEIVQEEILWRTVVGGRIASVSNDLVDETSHGTLFQAIFGRGPLFGRQKPAAKESRAAEKNEGPLRGQ